MKDVHDFGLLLNELQDGEKLKPQDVVKAIAARWKEEDQSVRDEWNAKAKTPATSDDEADTKPVAKAEKPKANAEKSMAKAEKPKPDSDVNSHSESDED